MRRDVFQAIADPTRRSILSLLSKEPLTPNHIAEHFESSRQAVSKHLGILVQCGLARPEYLGREIYYHLNLNKMKEIDKWLSQFRKQWEDRFNNLDNLLLKMKSKK